LHAVPKPPPKKEREGSRLQKLKAGGRHPKLPEVSCAYLLDILMDVGPAGSNGMGATPISEMELLAWQINRSHRLQPWEAKIIRRLSKAWVGESYAAEDANRPAPWDDEPMRTEELLDVANNLRYAMRALGRGRKA
jgi:hypothetical protein